MTLGRRRVEIDRGVSPGRKNELRITVWVALAILPLSACCILGGGRKTPTPDRVEPVHDRHGRLIATTEQVRDPKSSKVRTVRRFFTYDNLGRIQEAIEMDIESKIVTTKTDFTYDKQGRVVTHTERTQEPETSKVRTTTRTMAYNRLGQVQDELSKHLESGTVTGKTDYVYDQNGRLMAFTEQIQDPKSPQKQTETHFISYNSLGEVSEEIVIDHETGEITDLEGLRRALAAILSAEFDSILQRLNSEARAWILKAFKVNSSEKLRDRIRK